jgi:phosphomethylpyrimidine synthase
MKISQDIRDAARGQNDAGESVGMSAAEIRAALDKKAAEFRQHGSEIYLPKDAHGTL